MRKVAIITLYGANIGNRLQNYALQQILRQHKFDTYTYWYSLKPMGIKKLIKRFLGWVHVGRFRVDFVVCNRVRRFEKFTEKYIAKGKKINLNRKIKYEDEFEYYVTGSDQVWHNWHKSENELEYFYLTFVPKEKRIAFSASIGLAEFPSEDIEMHRYGLNGMKALSCRERNACEMIKGLTGRDAELLLDPTFLLDRSEWIKIEQKPKYEMGDRYVLMYFLGGTERNATEMIEKYALINGCKIINIFDSNLEEQYYTAPDEFIYLIHHANYIFTDSFHACAFSIIFEKQFLVFHRKELPHEKMGTRIDDLFERFHLEERWFMDGKEIGDCKYGNMSTVLWEERTRADKYIGKFMK